MKPITPQFRESLSGSLEKPKLGPVTKRNYPQLDEFLELNLKQKRLSQIIKRDS
jgi:hypothetical protein